MLRFRLLAWQKNSSIIDDFEWQEKLNTLIVNYNCQLKKAIGQWLIARETEQFKTAPFLLCSNSVITPCGGHGVGDGRHGRYPCHLVVHEAYALALPSPLALEGVPCAKDATCWSSDQRQST